MALKQLGRRFFAAPKWPFLRQKALTQSLAAFLQQGGQELWLTGPPGSGCATALRAALPQAPTALLLDLARPEAQVLRLALAQRDAERLERCVQLVLERHPKAAGHVAALVDSLTKRQGLAAALPHGTELQLERHQEPLSLVLATAEAVSKHVRALEPQSQLHAARLGRSS